MQSIATQFEASELQATSNKANSNNGTDGSSFRRFNVLDYLDLDHGADIERLKVWCQQNWSSTFRKAILHRNTMHYHECCNSFSRRAFSKGSGHPLELTCELHRIRSFKTVDSEDGLFRWLLSTAKENARQGRRTLFPSISLKHIDLDDIQRCPNCSQQSDMLRKRCQELEREVTNHKQLLTDLQNENLRLLRSSKTWHSKYEDLLDQRDPPIELYATPIKSHQKPLINTLCFFDC